MQCVWCISSIFHHWGSSELGWLALLAVYRGTAESKLSRGWWGRHSRGLMPWLGCPATHDATVREYTIHLPFQCKSAGQEPLSADTFPQSWRWEISQRYDGLISALTHHVSGGLNINVLEQQKGIHTHTHFCSCLRLCRVNTPSVTETCNIPQMPD